MFVAAVLSTEALVLRRLSAQRLWCKLALTIVQQGSQNSPVPQHSSGQQVAQHSTVVQHPSGQQLSQHSSVLISGQSGEWEHSVQHGSKHSPVPQNPSVQHVAQHSPVHQHPSVQQVSQCFAITNVFTWSSKRVGSKCSACVAITSAAAFEWSAQFAAFTFAY